MIRKLSNIERFLALPEEEKQAEIDRALADPGRPLTPAERQRWERVQAELKRKVELRRKLGRPRNGTGVKVISLSIEKQLLERADAEARKRRISRAALVAEGLEAVLSRRSA